ERTIVIERFFDGLGGTQIVIHSPFGIRFNRGLGLALRKRLCQNFDFEIQASAIDDGALIALNSRHSFPLEEFPSMLTSRTAREVLVQALLAAPMFEVRFRHVASRALTVMRASRGRKVPAWIQRLRSQELLTSLFPGQQACFENRPPIIDVPDHYVLTETVRECLEESTDLNGLVSLLEGIERGTVRTVFVDSISPSVFAHRLLLAWDYSFLDDGERGNRRSRTVQMNRGMAEEVFRSENLAEMLATEAVEAVVAEVSGRSVGRRPRSADELYELVRSHGSLSLAEIEDRAAGAGPRLAGELSAAGRLVRTQLRPDGVESYVAIEDIDLFRAAYAAAAESDVAIVEVVRRALRTSGPVSAQDVAGRLDLAGAAINAALASLEASGAIFRGHFTSAEVEQWCDRYNLERIHRMTLARVRAEIEPCSDDEFAAFRAQWMHLGGAGIAAGEDSLEAVLTQLAGMPFTPEQWETAILPARISGYRPEQLDLLCLSGRIIWAAISDRDARADRPARVAFFDHERVA
ncbi:MAG: DNA glycosylase AlkZ-like family protein, partial [Candidatus Binataceae bacterium]